jgi:hypothetical protein
LRLGADFRTQYLQESIKETSGDRSTFFLMQANLSVAADVSQRVALVYSNDQGRTLEAFALMGGFPMEGTIKAASGPHSGRGRNPRRSRAIPRFGNNAEDVGFTRREGPGDATWPPERKPKARFDDNAVLSSIAAGSTATEWNRGSGANNPGFSDRGEDAAPTGRPHLTTARSS